MADIISTNPSTLLEDFQSAYYNQMGKRMTIGSEEYTLSSVFTYVLSLYAGLINNSYKNQMIDTANGVFLDNIAARYNLSRTPDVYSNPWFEGRFWFGISSEYRGRSYDKGGIEISIGGHTYANDDAIPVATNNIAIRFVCIEQHSDYLSKSELIEALKNVKDSNNNNVFITSQIKSYNVSEMQGISNALSDDEFRDYIKSSKQLYVPGVAGSFEALAKASSKDITDARVRVQGDAGFIAGHVDMYCKPYHYATNHSDYTAMIQVLDIPKVASIIADKNLAVIGQTVNVYTANAISDVRQYTFFVPAAYNTTEYNTLYQYKFQAVRGYLNNKVLKINMPYIPSMAVTLMTKNLSELSTDPHDFGFAPEDGAYQNFDKYKDLPVIGLDSLSDYSKQDSNPSSCVYVNSSYVGFTFI